MNDAGEARLAPTGELARSAAGGAPGPPGPRTLRRLAEVAAGRAEADLVLTGGSLVNVFTEELQAGWGLAVADGRVACVGPDQEVAARAGAAT